MGVNDLLYTSIRKSDLDLRKTLYQNIVLSGGSTLFKGKKFIFPHPNPNLAQFQPASNSTRFFLGFGDRLLSELRKPSPKDTKIRISAPQERLYSTWIGGSILGKLLFVTLPIISV